MASTVRFSRVVEACGRPHVHTLWTKPADDAELKRARDAHRVMTVHRSRGKADYGTIGFAQSAAENEQYLIFPKSLRRFEDRRVVGVNFNLIEQPALKSVDVRVNAAPPTPRRHKRARAMARVIPFTPPAPPARDDARPGASARHPTPRSTHARSIAPKAAPTRPRLSPKTETRLERAVRGALKDLKTGKSMAAYQRLQRALDEE